MSEPDPLETRIQEPIPYGIGSWYPVLRGGPTPAVFVDAADPRGGARLARVWDALEEGGRVVLQQCPAAGARADLAPLEAQLSGQGSPERFVVFPGTGGSFTLLPTRDSASLRGGMALLPRGRARGRALWTALGALAPFGVPRRLGRPELAVWTKGGPADGSADLAVLPVAGSIAVTAGVPDRNQKVIVRALDRRGAARAVLKIGFSGRSDDAVEREARALERLADLSPTRAPRLIAEGERSGRRWMAQEVLEGGRGGDGIGPAHGAFLEELAGIGLHELPLDHVAHHAEARRQLTSLEPSFDPDWHAAYLDLARALEDASEDWRVPVHAAHGDFAPWNLALSGGHLRAFDWEYFAEDAPALTDLLHFHVHAGVLVGQHPGERVFDELEYLFAGPGGRAAAVLGLGRDDVLRLVALHVLHMGVTSEVLERLRPAPFPQAGWLRRARLVLCQRLSGLLRDRRLPAWTRLPAAGREAA